MLGLPYLTEYMGYKGRIVTTEPTVEYAKQRMEELVFYHGQKTSAVDPTSSTHFSELIRDKIPEGWRSIYTMKDILSCTEKVQTVRYTEALSLFSTLSISAFSSGYCLGSSNWLLEASSKKIAFLSPSSLYTSLHPAPFDFDIFKQADVIIVGGIKQQTEKELTYERARTKLLVQIARTIHSLHNVVLVTPSTGILFDLIGDIDSYFKSLGREVGHENHQTPIYVAYPVADQSLKYANICGEWMNSGRHDLLYVPEMPLAHGNFMNTGAVQVIQSLDALSFNGKSGIREPCIVFTGDPTCITKGFLPWFLNHWEQSDVNTCIFIDPDTAFDPQDDIPAGCKMTFNKIPLDTKLKLEDIPSLLHTYWERDTDNIQHLLLPHIKGAELVKEEQSQSKVYIYEPGEVLSIDLNRDWENVSLNEKLAITINPTILPTTDGDSISAWAPIHGSLNYYDNQLQIQPPEVAKEEQPKLITSEDRVDLNINTALNSIINKFEQQSIPISISKDINGVTTVKLSPYTDAKVVMNGTSTTIIASDDKMRALLRKIIVSDTL
ncbi:unnamed protein product [Mucor hiemalis]